MFDILWRMFDTSASRWLSAESWPGVGTFDRVWLGSRIVRIVWSQGWELRAFGRASELCSVDGLPVFESQQIQCFTLHRINEPVWRNVDGTFALQGES